MSHKELWSIVTKGKMLCKLSNFLLAKCPNLKCQRASWGRKVGWCWTWEDAMVAEGVSCALIPCWSSP